MLFVIFFASTVFSNIILNTHTTHFHSAHIHFKPNSIYISPFDTRSVVNISLNNTNCFNAHAYSHLQVIFKVMKTTRLAHHDSSFKISISFVNESAFKISHVAHTVYDTLDIKDIPLYLMKNTACLTRISFSDFSHTSPVYKIKNIEFIKQ